MKFSELDLNEDLLASIESLGFEEMTPIQEQAIPIALQGKDLIACAQTGTGKTAAYLIPAIQKLMAKENKHSRVLIIAPTRELADQIDQNVDALSYFTGVSSVAVYGGKNTGDWDRQTYAIKNGVDILICTPGRLNTHAALGYLNFDHIEIVILDEADKMLDMGFHPDILKIISQVPKDRQTLMFSATMPSNIRKLAKEIMQDPGEISLSLAKPAAGINQMAFSLYDEQKIPMLEYLIREREVKSMIIFASKKTNVDKIEKNLHKLGYGVRAIHSDREQDERTETLRQFKNGEFPIIVGTDVLARGIDIDNLSHVLNFDVPTDAEDYVHRVGRTARAESTGEAITFINPTDQYRFRKIEALIEMEVNKPEVPAELGDTPTYDPSKRPPRDTDRRGGGSRGGGGGDSRRGGGGRDRNDRGRSNGGSRRSGPRREASPRSRDQGSENDKGPQERQQRTPTPQSQSTTPEGGEENKKPRSRNRNRNRNRNKRPDEGQNPTGEQPQTDS